MKMKLLESIVTAIIALVLLFMAIDSEQSQATRIVSAVLFVGVWMISKLSEILQQIEKRRLQAIDAQESVEKRLDAISHKLYELNNR